MNFLKARVIVWVSVSSPKYFLEFIGKTIGLAAPTKTSETYL